MALKWPDPKDPDETVAYRIDWSARLDSDTIATSTWAPPDGLTVGTDSFDDTTATALLSGGTAGQSYAVLNRITTAGGQTMDQTAVLKVKDR